MPKRTRGKQLSGGAKLKAAGKHAVLLGIDRADYALIQQAANIERRPVAQFIAFAAVFQAQERIGEEARRYYWKQLEAKAEETVANASKQKGK